MSTISHSGSTPQGLKDLVNCAAVAAVAVVAYIAVEAISDTVKEISDTVTLSDRAASHRR